MNTASRVAPRLFVGPRPNAPEVELKAFDMVVFAADSYQPQLRQFRGEIVYAGIDDDSSRPIDDLEKRKVHQAAKRVAKALYDGGRVLVTCEMGWNRSGLVAALALRMCSHLSTSQIVLLIRQQRGEMALSNESFLDYLHGAEVTQAY